ncbi:2-oxo-4-hydroxy-4-carboxy-5-ureidoimidazoline decarboxylase-like [Maniola jurtina]|uniref:2-oxo-4-hydroxy-4-carboxy-5-ureidoimidazoline decarboxylase-like n=1 Tax=Maniola jurtina TaxID=191418 RepID=UPI001E687814|nr:2-oxo-4-hydroxy-4-carboxy-5-ureidoimidazoline decarboxylase-like [Maniola jurtina]
MGKLSVSEVNSMRDEQFEWVFRNVIELRPAAAACVREQRPFTDASDLCAAFHKYLDELSVECKLQVLKSHPDLAGRLAAEGELTQESTEEQRKAGLNELTVEQKAVMDSRNERYKKKFGFPFIICARENKIQSIIEGLNTRYNNILEQEIQIGIHEVKKICKLRILDIVS